MLSIIVPLGPDHRVIHFFYMYTCIYKLYVYISAELTVVEDIIWAKRTGKILCKFFTKHLTLAHRYVDREHRASMTFGLALEGVDLTERYRNVAQLLLLHPVARKHESCRSEFYGVCS
jgi:hypothetical protein